MRDSKRLEAIDRSATSVWWMASARWMTRGAAALTCALLVVGSASHARIEAAEAASSAEGQGPPAQKPGRGGKGGGGGKTTVAIGVRNDPGDRIRSDHDGGAYTYTGTIDGVGLKFDPGDNGLQLDFAGTACGDWLVDNGLPASPIVHQTVAIQLGGPNSGLSWDDVVFDDETTLKTDGNNGAKKKNERFHWVFRFNATCTDSGQPGEHFVYCSSELLVSGTDSDADGTNESWIVESDPNGERQLVPNDPSSKVSSPYDAVIHDNFNRLDNAHCSVPFRFDVTRQ